MLCDVCEAVLQSTRPYRYRPHHETFDSLKRSVQIGCFICTSVWTEVQCRSDLPSGWEAAVTSASTTLGMGDHRPNVGVIFSVNGGPCWSLDSTHAFRLLDGHAHPEIPRLSPSTRSTQTFSTAKQWIKTCTQSHEECNDGTPKVAWYPTRLLECGIDGDSETLRLVESSKTTVGGPYMTLSHCWGDADCLKLTTDNYTQLLQDIPLSAIPQLYRDALVVTKELSVKYLWVDSLCIIQHGDDWADWDREVNLMDQVYSNSFCNISALTAPDSHQSMFHDRNPDALYPPKACCTVLIPKPEPLEWTVINKPWTIINNPGHRWDTEVVSARLNTRAWVLQERLLSPRILHFGRSQVYWECRRLEASEVWPGGFPENIWPDYSVFCQRDFYSRRYTSAGWWRIIEVYSACEVTFPKDRLVAMSAVARRAAAAFQDTYVAGLWRSALEDLLSWRVVPRNGPVGTRAAAGLTEVYCAPSWSWASVDVPVRYIWRNHPGLLVEAQEVHLDYATADKMGRLTGGWLRLHGLLQQMEPRPPGHDSLCTGLFVGWGNDRCYFSMGRISSYLDAQHRRDRIRLFKSAEDGFLYCVPLWINKNHSASDKGWAHPKPRDSMKLAILILERVDNEGREGDFRRVGCVDVSVERRDWHMLRELLGFSMEDDTVDWGALRDIISARLQTFTIE
ncbi:hypothetical protein RB595_004989 [Gaeumannomyces hyphopodioides]